MKIELLFILLVVLIFVKGENKPYRKVMHGVQAKEARCLDGSPAAMYISDGDPKNMLVYFVGGADCSAGDLVSTLYSCWQRGKMHLGSSLYWP